MKRSIGLHLGLIVLLSFIDSTSYGFGLPVVLSTAVNSSSGTLTINGQNFGTGAAVTMNTTSFPITLSGANQILAAFPADKPVSTFTPGTYLLTLTFRNQLPVIFTVVVGASGLPGPTGAQGPAGPTGPTGSLGPTGPQGLLGPQGLAGPIGPAGPPGVAGPIGPAGATGPLGAQGPKGDKGDSGSAGGGLVCSTAPNIYLVTAANGAQSCQPRYMDNGDFTVTDNQTGLMWEKKFDPSIPIACTIGDRACPPDPHHEVNNLYTYSDAALLNSNGTLYSDFLQYLNGLHNGAATPSCFAEHCDWRIPSIGELRSILPGLTPTCVTPCVPDPAVFGPSATYYWSSSPEVGDPYIAWYIDFATGTLTVNNGLNRFAARAVRGGR
jgi:Protein of unknown function (DUF1566)/Collagen triple helix repeat (20 copies)